MDKIFILIYALVTLACMSVLAYVMTRQYREVRRPRNAFTQLRWRLFWLPTVILAGLALGLPRLFVVLFPALEANSIMTVIASQAVRVVSGIIVLVGITLLILGIYTFREKK